MGHSRRTIAVDFDGVIANYDGWKGAGVLGAPRADVVEALRTLRAEGWKIAIHSTRCEQEIAEYLTEQDIPCDEIRRNSACPRQGVKPRANVCRDDRAVCYSGDARKDLDSIRNFCTWNGRE